MITVRVEMDAKGGVNLLEPVKVGKRSRAKVTADNEGRDEGEHSSNASELLALMNANCVSEDARVNCEGMAQKIEEARRLWD